MYLNVAEKHCTDAVGKGGSTNSRLTGKLQGTGRKRVATDKVDAQGQVQRWSEKPADL